jgi:hypothetical protein
MEREPAFEYQQPAFLTSPVEIPWEFHLKLVRNAG